MTCRSAVGCFLFVYVDHKGLVLNKSIGMTYPTGHLSYIWYMINMCTTIANQTNYLAKVSRLKL